MFARTPRLLLRPGWAEDAPALAAAIGDEGIVRNLGTVPWPYRLRDAEAFLAGPRDPVLPSLLAFRRTAVEPELVGGCSLRRKPSGAVELGYWTARAHWGRGFATEAAAALVDIARALRIARVDGAHFTDNPASGRVLEKLDGKMALLYHYAGEWRVVSAVTPDASEPVVEELSLSKRYRPRSSPRTYVVR